MIIKIGWNITHEIQATFLLTQRKHRNEIGSELCWSISIIAWNAINGSFSIHLLYAVHGLVTT